MVKNIIFDFDGVIVDSEIIVARSLSIYLAKRNIKFHENDFSSYAGNKTFQVIEKLSQKFNIEDNKKFFNDIMKISQDLYLNKLEKVKGVKFFLENINHKKLIGSNNIAERIIKGLNTVGLDKFFEKKSIFSFDLVGVPKPEPDIYLKAIEATGINKNETIILEDSSIGAKAGVAAGVKVIGITAGGHWYNGRSEQELYDAGAYEVVKSYKEMLLLLEKL